MYLVDAGRNAQLNGFIAQAAYLSAHTSFSTSGGNEVAGGTPAYARKAITWGTAASGQVSNSVLVQADIPAGTDVWWQGYWTAVTSGTFLGMVPLGGKPLRSVSVNGSALFSQTAHGLTNGLTVVMFDIKTTGLPTGFTEGTVYYVVNAAADTFNLAATAGGAAISTTSATEVFMKEIVKQTFAAQGKLDWAPGALLGDATID